MTTPITKCPAGYAYGYVPINSGREVVELDDDGFFNAAIDVTLAAKKSPLVTAGKGGILTKGKL